MPSNSGSLYVVVVENNRSDKKLLQNLSSYSKMKWDLKFISDGNEALKYVSDRGRSGLDKVPDLILLDINVPKVDAWEVLRKIRISHRLSSVPTLVLCGSDSVIDDKKVQDFGAAILKKPKTLSELSTLIDRIEWFWKKNSASGE